MNKHSDFRLRSRNFKAVILTVLCSILAHGVTALPGTKLYARKVAGLPPDAPEFGEAEGG